MSYADSIRFDIHGNLRPRPFLVVHLIEPGRLMTVCGRWPGDLRFDKGHRTLVQDTARYSLSTIHLDGEATCPVCADHAQATRP